MRYLLDTHAFLWIVREDNRLTDEVRDIFSDSTTEILLSVVSIWEMAIKIRLGKLEIEGRLGRFIDKHAIGNNVRLLNVSEEHVLPLEKLPLHHRDPFDRLLVCQSKEEKLPILSSDKIFDNYRIKRIW
jgi:PIN domain nuclease of toxin-antitoxin system